MTVEIITAGLLLAGLWSVLCRVNLMQHGRTAPLVFMQHALLGIGLFAALVLPVPLAKLAMAAGVCAFLVMGAARWRYAAPQWTETADGDLGPPIERASLDGRRP
jgi:hypothetical protein